MWILFVLSRRVRQHEPNVLPDPKTLVNAGEILGHRGVTRGRRSRIAKPTHAAYCRRAAPSARRNRQRI